MAKILQDMWIITQNGQVLFKRVFQEMLDAQLFGGLMSALNALASQMSESGLSNFDLGEKRYTILKKQDLFFVANYARKIQPKKASKELEGIMEKFFSNYTVDAIKGWNGDLSTFSKFESEIEESLEDVVKKFEDAFW